MTKLLAFHNDPAIKEKYLQQVKMHAAADEIIKGKYWEGGQGCAVGCTIHGNSHTAYETELGISRIIARLEDGIFEGLPNEEAMTFPVRFLEAVPVGADLSLVFYQFMHWLLVDPIDGVIKFANEKGKIALVSAVAVAAAAANRNYARIKQAEKLLELLRNAPVPGGKND